MSSLTSELELYLQIENLSCRRLKILILYIFVYRKTIKNVWNIKKKNNCITPCVLLSTNSFSLILNINLELSGKKENRFFYAHFPSTNLSTGYFLQSTGRVSMKEINPWHHEFVSIYFMYVALIQVVQQPFKL